MRWMRALLLFAAAEKKLRSDGQRAADAWAQCTDKSGKECGKLLTIFPLCTRFFLDIDERRIYTFVICNL